MLPVCYGGRATCQWSRSFFRKLFLAGNFSNCAKVFLGTPVLIISFCPLPHCSEGRTGELASSLAGFFFDWLPPRFSELTTSLLLPYLVHFILLLQTFVLQILASLVIFFLLRFSLQPPCYSFYRCFVLFYYWFFLACSFFLLLFYLTQDMLSVTYS